mgnify:FL=1
MDSMFNTLSAQNGAVQAMVPFSGNPDLEMSFIRLEGQTFAPLLCGNDSNYPEAGKEYSEPGDIAIGYMPVYNYFRFLVMSLTGGKDPARSKSWVQDLLKNSPELRGNLQYLYQWNETVRHSSYKTSNEVFYVVKSLVNDLNIDTVKMVPVLEEYRPALPTNKAGTLKVLDYYLDMTKSAKTTDSDRYYTFLLDMIQAGEEDAACLVTHPALFAMVNAMAEVDGKLLPKAVMGELFQQGINPQNMGLDHFYAITTGYFLRTYLCQIKFCDRQMSAGAYYRILFGGAAEMSPQIDNAFRMGYHLGLKEYKTYQQEVTPEVARLIKKRVDLIVNVDAETRRAAERKAREAERAEAVRKAKKANGMPPATKDGGKAHERKTGTFQPSTNHTPQPESKKPMFSWNAKPDPNKSAGENLKAAFSWGGKASGGAGIPSLGDLAGAAKPAAQPKDDPNDPGTPKTIDQFGGAKAEKRTLNLHAHQWKGSNEAEIAAFTGGNASRNPDGSLTVQTTEGALNYPQNAWVVRDVVGQYYAVKDEKFQSIYSHVSGDVYACKGGNQVDFIQWTGSNQDAVRKFCPGAQFLGSVVGVAASWDPSQMLTGNSGCWIACYDRSKNDYAIVQNDVFRKSYKFI